METPDLSIIILTWRGDEPLQACLESIPRAARNLKIEVIVVANGVEAPVPAYTHACIGAYTVIHNASNRGVAAGRNQGLQAARGRYLLLLDADTCLTEGALSNLMDFAESHPPAGLLGPRLVDAHGELQLTCRRFPTLWTKMLRRMPAAWASDQLAEEMLSHWDHSTPREVDYVIGACQMIRRQAFEETGYLDERIFYGPEDVDYCLRMWQHGWRVMYVPQATVIHAEQRLTRRHLFSALTLYHALGLIHYLKKHGYLWHAPTVGQTPGIGKGAAL